MVDADGRNEAMDPLAQLAAVVVDSIQNLRSRRQPVTVNTLRDCLENRTELRQILQAEVPFKEPQEPPSLTSPMSQDATQLEIQLGVLGDQKARLLRDVTQLEEQQQHLWDFTAGALLTLTTWLEASSQGAPFGRAIKRFKARLKEADNLAGIEDSFASLKDQILKENPEAMGYGNDRAAARSPLKSLPGAAGREPDRDPGAGGEDWPAATKDVLNRFLGNLEPSVPDSVTREMALVRSLVSGCRTYDDWLNLREPVVRLGRLCAQGFRGEREQFARLIKEIDQNLKEMEKNLLDSLGEARAMARSNTDFTARVAEGMDEMTASMQTSQDLDELRQVVVTKLTFLRQALETKRKDDAQRLAHATEKMDDLQRNVTQMRQEMSAAQEQSRQLEEQLQQDALTGLLSRRGYEERMAQEFERYRRYRQQLSLIVFDLDHFKQVNDQFGHQSGDKCLKLISRYIRPVIRKSDALARYGGDEFVLILPGIDCSGAAQVAEKIRHLVEQIRFLYEGRRVPLSLSMGVAQADERDESAEHLFKRADQALYAAKEEGRNRVKVHDEG